jgi:hypothetical protein
MPFDPAFLSNLVLISTALASAFLVALWFSLIIWTYRDARQRVRYQPVQILAAVVVAVLFLPGIFIYLILRPAHTLEEDYQQALEEEALLHSIEESMLCPGCSRKVQVNWIVCPNCHTRLRKPCPRCGKAVELSWDVCPYCTTPLNPTPAPAAPATPVTVPPEQKAEGERPIYL